MNQHAGLLVPDWSFSQLGFNPTKTTGPNTRSVVTLFPRPSTTTPTFLRLVQLTGHNNTDTFVSTLLLTFPPLNS